MTFEGFDAAPLIEAAGFTPVTPALAEPAAPDAATLDAALREAARTERAAIRAEATVLDLWIDRVGGSNLRALDRPGLGAGTSWHAGALLAEDSGVLDLTGGGFKTTPLFAALGEEEDDSPAIVVVGPSVDEGDDDGGWTGGGYGDGSYGDNGHEGGGPGEGGGQGDVYTRKEIPHPETCATPDGAAVQIADKIKATDDVYGPVEHHWGNAEYSALVVATGNRFGALRGVIVTYGALDFSIPPSPSPGDLIEGIVHNHPDALGNTDVDLQSRYPSDEDWEELRQLHNAYSAGNPNYDPSLWIIGSDGIVREFKYSEMSQFYGDAMTYDQRADGEGLEGKERTNSCGSS